MSTWLDRFSAHTPPSLSPAAQRTVAPSPVPRRSLSIAPVRPGLQARTPSIALVSEAVLPANARIQQASALRNQLSSSPPPNVRNPLEALADVLGIEPASIPVDSSRNDNESTNPTELPEEVDFAGLSLQEFVDLELHSSDTSTLYKHSQQSVENYGEEQTRFEDLHKQIQTCDEVLHSVERYLSSFQADLAAVSAEIETLQNRSTALNNKLENRTAVERMLNPVINRVTLSPAVVKYISERPLDETWSRSLEELNTRQKTAVTEEKLKDIRAIEDLKPVVNDLSDKAVERIRDYYAVQIKALRAPNVNAQVNQQQYFLRMKPAYTFLATRQPQLGGEIAQAYTNTMRWYYSNNFSRYHAALSKLKLQVTDNKALLGEDPHAAARNRTPATASSMSHDPFNLGRRIEPLRNPSSTALPSSAAEETKNPQQIETPFIAFNLALLDNASFEYSFATAFFPPSASIPSINRYFQTMFAPVLALGTQLTKSLIAESYDALGVLLLVRLIQHFAFILQRRKVPTLDAYINGTSMLLWPRFQQLLDAHCDSLKKLTASLPSRPAGTSGAAAAASALIGGGGASSTGGGVGGTTAPHAVTQRFAMFVAGILALSTEAGDNEPVSNSLLRLRAEYEAFLAKLGQGFGPGEKGRRDRKRMEMNNYALILTVLGDAKGRLAEEMRGRFEELVKEGQGGA